MNNAGLLTVWVNDRSTETLDHCTLYVEVVCWRLQNNVIVLFNEEVVYCLDLESAKLRNIGVNLLKEYFWSWELTLKPMRILRTSLEV